MPVTKQHIAVFCGGQSTEHEISVLSARNVIQALDPHKYQVQVIYVTRTGAWYLLKDAQDLMANDPKNLIHEQRADALILIPGQSQQPFALANNVHQTIKIDCVFPLLHGTLGEDGTFQGLCDMLNVPYVGADVLGSALCMQKHIAKRLLRYAKLPTADWLLINEHEQHDYPFSVVSEQLGNPLMIKPVSLGSSVGMAKVRTATEYEQALSHAFTYDDQVIIEQVIVGRELECSVLGNEKPVASLPGEVITSPKHDFYSYEAKYLDPEGARTKCPADMPQDVLDVVQEIAVQAYKVLQCRGMAR